MTPVFIFLRQSQKLLIRRYRWILVISICVITYFWLVRQFSSVTSDVEVLLTSNQKSIEFVRYPDSNLILLWTGLFSNPYWHQDSFFNRTSAVICSNQYRCQFTRRRDQLSNASLVAFHLYDLKRAELPERRTFQNQTWLFLTGESPVNFYYQNPTFYPRLLNNYFDRSISYKSDSPLRIFSYELKSRSSIDSQEKQLNINSLNRKSKPIAWIVSNCATFSQREKYVEELRKFIPVDIFGKCGTACAQGDGHRCEVDLNQYYFYLSFENSRCNDYITEKFWNIITDNEHRLVPIVMGPKEQDYARIAPKQSYIHVNSYETPMQLAKYLQHLIANPQQYLTYLEWREHTQINLSKSAGWTSFLCPLCQMSYESRFSSASHRLEFSSWYDPETQCHHDDIEVFRKCKQATLNGWMNWIHWMKCP